MKVETFNNTEEEIEGLRNKFDANLIKANGRRKIFTEAEKNRKK
jgi:hypothetical protein